LLGCLSIDSFRIPWKKSMKRCDAKELNDKPIAARNGAR
jgi:hypothetical protein